MKVTKEEFREIMTEIGWLHEGWTNRLYDKLVEADRAKCEPARVILSDGELEHVWRQYFALDLLGRGGKDLTRLIREAESKHGGETTQPRTILPFNSGFHPRLPDRRAELLEVAKAIFLSPWKPNITPTIYRETLEIAQALLTAVDEEMRKKNG